MAIRAKKGPGVAVRTAKEKVAAPKRRRKAKANEAGPTYEELAIFAAKNPPPATWLRESAADLTKS
jgi:hypothetical protein